MAAKKKATTKTHITLHNVRHDGRAYGVGSKLQLTDEQAKRLVQTKAVKLASDQDLVEAEEKAEGEAEEKAEGEETDLVD